MVNSFERIRDAVESAGLTWWERRAGIEASFQTPGHSAADRGTSVKYNGEMTLIYCHNGDTDQVLEELGLSKADLFDQPRTEYTYPDARIVFRTADKKFTQRGNTQGTALFGSDRLVAEGPVYVCEGEKDVNTAINVAGVNAVSQAMGAKTNPDKADWSPLAGRDVIIVADDDKPGLERAEKVAAHLSGLRPPVSSLVVAKALVGNDFSDHIAAGKTVAELVPLDVDVATPAEGYRAVHLESFSEMEWDLPTWIWTPEHDGKPIGAIPLGSLVLFSGRPAAGKSSAGRDLAAKVTKGLLPGHWHGTPHAVAYIAGEESSKYVVTPSLIASGADLTKIVRPTVKVSLPDGEVETVAIVPERDMQTMADMFIEKGVKLVVLDPLMDFVEGVDLYKSNEVRAKLRPWSKLAEAIDGVVIGITHLKKSGNGDVVAGINGSSAFGEVARAVFGFAKDPKSEGGERVMSLEKNSLGDC